jgi:hypothetical protein
MYEMHLLCVADKFGDTLTADAGFALLWPLPEDHLFVFQQEVYTKFFAPERCVHGKIEVENIHKPPVISKCETHPTGLVFQNEDDEWQCTHAEDGTPCDITTRWQLRVNVVHKQQEERVLVTEELAPQLFEGIHLRDYDTNFTRYAFVLGKARWAVLLVKEGVVQKIQHGPSEVPTMDS